MIQTGAFKRVKNFPVLLGDALAGEERFPFRSWAASTRFKYPKAAEDILAECGSAAEAWFIRPFCLRPGFCHGEGRTAAAGDVTIELQARAATYLIDVVVRRGDFALAVEIDGLQYHTRTGEQVARDYVRERRIVLVGYTVIRFTAQEAFAKSDECWRQIDAILERRGRTL